LGWLHFLWASLDIIIWQLDLYLYKIGAIITKVCLFKSDLWRGVHVYITILWYIYRWLIKKVSDLLPYILVSAINKNYHHKINEILFKVALRTHNSIPYILHLGHHLSGDLFSTYSDKRWEHFFVQVSMANHCKSPYIVHSYNLEYCENTHIYHEPENTSQHLTCLINLSIKWKI
jgi:hypothetical protein